MDKFLKRKWFEIKEFTQELFDKDPMHIKPYLSYSNTKKTHIKGRILEKEGVAEIESMSMLENLINNLRSLESDEAKHTKVVIEYQDKIVETTTDDDGYFDAEFNIDKIPTDGDELEWSYATIIAPEYRNDKGEVLKEKIKIILPHKDTEDIIVSDIDDTILVTNVNSFLKLKLIYNTLFKNEKTRLPFEEMPEVLHELMLNKDGKKVNPVFYLSNSPWNLYSLLLNFFKFHDIPIGPLFLRDYGIKFGKELEEFRNHKINTLEHLINFYDDEKFILLGDATESDTEIYLSMYKKYKDRIEHIYIREDKEKTNQKVLDTIAQFPDAPIHLIAHSSDILEIKRKKTKQ